MIRHTTQPLKSLVLAKLREQQRSQISLAKQLNISRQQLNAILNGKSTSLKVEIALHRWLYERE